MEEVEEDSKEEKTGEEENSASYNLRPRKPVDYTVTSPEAKTSGTGADSERLEDKSDVSFKVDEDEKENDQSPQKEEGEITGSPQKTHDPQNSDLPKEENNEEAQESDSEDEDMEKVSPEELKDELKDLQGKDEIFY
jgi:hypothetical protein